MSSSRSTSPTSASSRAPKNDTELKLLTNMVEALAQKLKKRDNQIQKLQEKADMFNEVSLKLESSEERMFDMEAQNQSLSALFRASQGETDELRDQLVAVTNMLAIQKCASADASCSSFDISSLPPSTVLSEVPARPSLQGNLKELSNLWDSGRSLTMEWAVSSRSLYKEKA
jgi:hypothetical protein